MNGKRTPTLSYYAPVLAVIAIAVAQRFYLPANADIAWYIVIAERLLDGQRLYVDVIDTNPPFSVYLYIPATWLGRALSIRAESVIDAMTFAVGAASLALCAAILRQTSLALAAATPARISAVLALIFVLPASTFGEREHLALMAFLPFLCLHLARSEAVFPDLKLVAAAGVLAGIVFCIKPHFALAAAPLVLIAMWRARSVRPLFEIENLIAAACLAAYAVRLYWFEPAFTNFALPLMVNAYLPLRYGFFAFLLTFISIEVSLAALVVIGVLRAPGDRLRMQVRVISAIAGFFIAVQIRGKGLPYHFYPAIALALLLAFDAGLSRATSSVSVNTHAPNPLALKNISPALILAVLMFGYNWSWFNAGFDMRSLFEPVRQIAPHPRIAAIGYDFSVGITTTRAVEGKWVGSLASQWATENVRWLLDNTNPDDSAKRKLNDIETWDKQTLANDIARGDPDVILIQRAPDDWLPWALRHPGIGNALQGYVATGRYKSGGMRTSDTLDIELWRKK